MPRKVTVVQYLVYLNDVCTATKLPFDRTYTIFLAGANHNDPSQSETQSGDSQLSPQHRVQVALEVLKTQHETLLKSLHALSYIETGTNPSTTRASPLPSTAEEDEDAQTIHSQDLYPGSRFSAPITRKPTRTSITTSTSDGTASEWFDAPDGGEEFFLELDEPAPGEEKDEVGLMGSSTSSLGGSSDAEEEAIAAELLARSEEVEVDPGMKAKHVARRVELPSGPVGDEGSLFTVLKKNVGKASVLLASAECHFIFIAGSFERRVTGIIQ